MPTYNELKLAHYQANGATSTQLQDAERQFLLAQPATTDGHLIDMWKQFLDPTYPNGTTTDKRHQYWKDVGVKP